MSGKPLLVVVLVVLVGLAVVAAVVSLSGRGESPVGPGAAPEAPSAPEAGRPELPLPPLPPRVEGEVGGKVLGPNGVPLEGAVVSLLVSAAHPDLARSFRIAMGGGEAKAQITPGDSVGSRVREVARATSGAGGTFSIRTAEEGPFRVTATAAGLARATADRVERGTTDLVLTLRAAGSVRGLVRDEAGTAVEGAVVGAAGEETLADETGAFELVGVPAGEAAGVSANANGYESASASVEVVEGEVNVLDAPLVLKAEAGATGRVFDPRGEPLAGVRVTVGSGFDGFAMDTTDAGGRYHLSGLETRELDLVLKHPEYLAAKLDGFRYEKGSRLVLPDVRVEPGGAIAGRIHGPDGTPVAGAKASAMRSDQGFDLQTLIMSGLGSVTLPESGPDGSYRVAGLETGSFSLIVRAEGYRPFVKKGVAVRIPETTPVDVTLDRGLGVAGRVLDASGAPVAGANVTVSQDRTPTSIQDAMLYSGESPSATTGEDGAFVVVGLAEGDVNVTVHAEGFASAFLHEAVAGQTDLEIRLDRTGAVSGRVIDAETGAPVANARVSIAGGSGTAGEDGTFRVEGARPGTAELEANAEDYAPGIVAEVVVTAGGETKGVEVRLPRGTRLSGIVVRAADQSPVAGARVSASGDVSRTVKAGEDGRFTLKGIPAGSYEVEASADGLVDGSVSVVVPADGELRIALVLGGTIRGIVRNEHGEPIAGKMVMLSSGGDFGSGMATSDSEGRFVLENVKPGKVSLVLWDMGGGGGGMSFDAKTKQVTVREGEEIFVEFGGRPAAKRAVLKGRLLDHGKPVAGRMVMLFPVGRDAGQSIFGGFKMATTDAEGGFTLGDLEPGRYAMITGDMGSRNMNVGSELEIKEGGEIQQDIELPAGTLAGSVKGEGGAPVAGARVALIVPERATTAARTLGEVLTLFKGQAESGEDGAFRIGNATPGRYLLLAGAEGYASTYVEGVVVAEQGTGPVAVSLRRGSELKVRVLGPDGAGVPRASVYVMDRQGRWLLSGDELAFATGSDGSLSLRLERGRYRFAVQSGDHAPCEREVTVAGDAEVSIVLDPGGAASLAVRSAGGAVAGAEVRVFGPDGREIVWRVTQESMMTGSVSTRTGEDGDLLFEHLPPGEVRFVVTAPDGRTGEGAARIAAGTTAELAIEVE